MRLHDLKPAPGSHRDRKRLGRGNASGQGTTAGKGTKGQKARAGGLKAGFRGMSSRNQRMPKRRGFTNIFKVAYQPINVDKLAAFANATVDAASLVTAGLVKNDKTPIKILGRGEIDVPVTVVGLVISASARQKIEAAGGSVTVPQSGTETETSDAQVAEAEVTGGPGSA